MSDSLRVGIIGMGGFAAAHHDAVRDIEKEGVCRLVCTCDPKMARFADREKTLEFDRRGVRRFSTHEEMLDSCAKELDVVTIPTPIPLHAPMHRTCVERGLSVYLEKPPTVNWAELEDMIAVDIRAPKQTNVGFSYIVEPLRQRIKERLVSGEFGAVKRVSVIALWPRGTAYYARASWAGRLMADGAIVLDSPMSNAMGHLVHNALFWCGAKGVFSWAPVSEVEAEIYRAHAIEGADTLFVKGRVGAGLELRVAMSHACGSSEGEEEVVECEEADIHYTLHASDARGSGQLFKVCWKDGRVESDLIRGFVFLRENMRQYFEYVQGRRDRPLTRLEDCRPFVHFNDLAYIAAGRIHTVPAPFSSFVHEPKRNWTVASIEGVREAAWRFVEQGVFPSRQSLPWAGAGGKAVSADLPKLASVVADMANRRKAELAAV